MHAAADPGDADAGPGASVSRRAVEVLARVTARLPGGEVRPQQLEMCEAVADAIDGGRHLVVQAGTGTGKSLAYAVPAAVCGRRVVVATATKALQDQLAGKDLPAVAGVLEGGLFAAVLKGRSNYVCRQRVEEVRGAGVQLSLPGGQGGGDGDWGDGAGDDGAWEDGADGADGGGDGGGTDQDAGSDAEGTDPPALEAPEGFVAQVRRIVSWSDETESGDRAELPFEPHPRAWAMLSVGPRECPGAFRCPSGGRCFAERARDRAAAADIVVVNTHLYGMHLATGGAVLPPHDVVVFDEAHEVESVMTSSLGAEITPGRLRSLATAARPLVRDADDERAWEDVAECGVRLQAALEDRTGTRVLRDPEVVDGADAALDGELAALLERCGARVDRLLGVLRRAERASSAAVGGDGGADGGGGDNGGGGGGGDAAARRRSAERAARLTRTMSAAGHLADDLARLARRTADEVLWVDGNRRQPVLRLSPIDVGPPLAGVLWGEVTAVLTSATIPQRLVENLGLAEFPHLAMDVGSPFDYRTHALLYVASKLPDRRRPESVPALHDELEHLIRAAGGRTLALFTSHESTERAVEALRPRLGFRLLAQGDLPKARLLEEFAGDEESCLFATLSFWQGVDVPGRSLSLVTLDRLPFPRPDDPLLEARRERAGNAAFRLVDLPRAATLLAQGAGRLIRTADDYGVVAVLDSRLATASYRGVLLAGLPPMRRTVERQQVEVFLRRILGHEAATPQPDRQPGRGGRTARP